MAREGYIRDLRDAVGSRALLMPSVAAFVHHDGQVVAGLHRDLDLWVLPGGGLEPGERPADCAVREVWEETGLEVAITGVRGVFGGTPDHRVVYPNGDVCDYVVTVYDTRWVGGTLAPATEELAAVEWVTLDELARRPTPGWVGPLLAHPRGWEPVTWTAPTRRVP